METIEPAKAAELFDRVVKKFKLQKDQSQVNVWMCEGRISTLERVKATLENLIKSRWLESERKKKSFKNEEESLKKFDMQTHGQKAGGEIYELWSKNRSEIAKEREDLSRLKALAEFFEKMDDNLIDNIFAIDNLQALQDSKMTVAPDIQFRLDNGLCSLKRPGRVKFPCSEPNVEGERYCKEHLKEFDPVRYVELFESEVRDDS